MQPAIRIEAGKTSTVAKDVVNILNTVSKNRFKDEVAIAALQTLRACSSISNTSISNCVINGGK